MSAGLNVYIGHSPWHLPLTIFGRYSLMPTAMLAECFPNALSSRVFPETLTMLRLFLETTRKSLFR